MLVQAAAERRYVRAILAALGATDDEASTFADAICEADLRGYTSHGLLRVPETVVFVVFDEALHGEHVAAFALGTAVRPHSIFARRVDHYGLLATIEDLFGLPRLGAARRARPIIGIWR